jgi:hypothetical protein
MGKEVVADRTRKGRERRNDRDRGTNRKYRYVDKDGSRGKRLCWEPHRFSAAAAPGMFSRGCAA